MDLKQLLERSGTIAVVGFSTDPAKTAHRIPRQMMDAGWTVIPIHRTATEVAGQKAYSRLADVPVPIDLVDVFRPPRDAADVTRQAVEAGAKAVWLQLGITSDEARRIAADAGIDYVEDRCIAVEARQLGARPPSPTQD